MFLSDEGPTLETLNFAFYIGSIPTCYQISICIFEQQYRGSTPLLTSAIWRLLTFHIKIPNSKDSPNPNSYDNALF